MTKFVLVKALPKNVGKEEYVITMPDFTPEIERCKGRAPAHKATAPNHLRAIAMEIGNTYAPMTFNAYTDVVVNKFEGIEYKTNEELNQIVLNMFMSGFPQIVDLYIDNKIKARPFGTKLIYFTGPHQ